MWASGKSVRWFDIVSDADQGGTPPTGTSEGEIWIANNWGGGSVTDGHYASWDGAAWSDEGTVNFDDCVVVNGSDTHTPGGNFTDHNLQILRYDTTSRDYVGKAWVRVDSNASVKIAVPSQKEYTDFAWMWTQGSQTWRPIGDGWMPLRIYSQNDAPDIGSGESAIWKDTDDGNKVYLIYNDGGDLLGVEMTVFSVD